jgi:hypothetical protein
MATLIMHYDQDPDNACELITLAQPTQDCKIAGATQRLAVQDIAVLVSPTYCRQRQKYYEHRPGVTVYPMLLDWQQLTAKQLKALMRVNATDVENGGDVPLYMSVILDVLRGSQRDDNMPDFGQFMDMCNARQGGCGFSNNQLGPLRQRLALLSSIVLQSHANWGQRFMHKTLQQLTNVSVQST